MRRFTFRLEPVLRHRERTEEEREVAFAAALGEQRAAEAERGALLARRDETRAGLVASHRALDGEALRGAYAHLAWLDRELVAAGERVAAAAAAAERARLALVEARRDREVLDALRERHRAAHAADAARDEQRLLDDQNARLHERAHSRESPA